MPHTIEGTITPLKDNIIVVDIEEGTRKTFSGIIIMDDNMKDRGIRPRWSCVWSVGENVDYLTKGEWILIEHGRWTRGIELDSGETIRMIDPDSILLVTAEDPREEFLS